MKPNDTVKLIGIPTDVTPSEKDSLKTYEIFSKAVGNKFRVQGLNDLGMAELYLNEDGMNSDSPCDDSIWVEPN